MDRWSLPLALTLLAATGLSIATYRHLATGMPLAPGAERLIWQVEARIQFEASGGPAEVLLTLPPDQSGLETLSETGASPGFGFTVDQAGRQRRAHWTKRQAEGDQVLFYTLEITEDPQRQTLADALAPVRAIPFDGPQATAAREVLALHQAKSTSSRSLAEQLVRAAASSEPDQNMNLLRQQYRQADLIAGLMLLSGAKARTVQALPMEDGRRRQRLRDYVQVWHAGAWILFDPWRGLVEEQQNLLLWQTDTPSVLDVTGGDRSRVSYSMVSKVHPTLGIARDQFFPFDLGLHSLPIAEQGMLKLIMTLPVGALVVVLLRLLVGVRTSGTFMPVLIALALLQTELLAGLIGLLLVVSAGLLLRFYLSALNLLLVARIAAIVVLVIAIVTLIAIVSYRIGLISGLAITFFPMIILAWTVERMSIIWEEEGPGEALIQGAGSLLVAILAYLVMDLNLVQHLAFNFPELHFCILAALLLLGRYTGYRLLELHRFRPLVRPGA